MNIDIETILKYYNEEFGAVNLEVRLLEALYETQQWSKLNDKEKQEVRRKKNKFNIAHGLAPQQKKIFEYEESVIQLVDFIIEFIPKADILFVKAEAIKESDELILFFRLRNMLFCEKEFVNRLPDIKIVGHVPFEVVKPILDKLRDTEFYFKYNLLILEELYEDVNRLHRQNPYQLS
jgi:hypothetical protein